MKKTITLTAIIISLLIIFEVTNFGQSLLLFLLAGVIPGTNIALPATTVLIGIIVTLCLVIISIALFNATRIISSNRLTRHHIATKKRMPHRRFSHI